MAALGDRLAVNAVPHLGEVGDRSVAGWLDRVGVGEVVLLMLVSGACMVVVRPVVGVVER